MHPTRLPRPKGPDADADPKGSDTPDAVSPPPLIDYENDHPDAPTRGTFRIGGLAIASSAVLCVAFILWVVMRPGGL